MNRFVAGWSILVVALMMGSVAPSHGAVATCPPDIRAAIAQACPCDGFRNHGKFMGCVRKQLTTLRAAGCDENHLKRAVNCANSSVCGKVHKPIVCCSKLGGAKVTSPKACSDRGGQVISGAISPCDAACGTHSIK